MRALRWLLILPAAILSILIAQFPIHWVVVLLMHENGFLHFMTAETLENLLRAAIVPAVFVFAGSNTAPGWRFHTAMVLAVLLTVMVSLGVAHIARQQELTDSIWLMILKGALWLGSIAAAVYKMWQTEN